VRYAYTPDPLALVFLPSRKPAAGQPATVQLDMHFVDALKVGAFVEAKCQVVRRTRSLIFMSGELMVGERVVATAKGVWETLGKK
jgi:acyl-coenzyme A thioesterase PaaI-like protein